MTRAVIELPRTTERIIREANDLMEVSREQLDVMRRQADQALEQAENMNELLARVVKLTEPLERAQARQEVWPKRDFERPRSIGIFVPQHNHTHANENEREQSADVRQTHHLIDRRKCSNATHRNARKDRRDVRRLEPRMNGCELRRQQTIARH